MLVLNFQEREGAYVGREVHVVVLEVRGGQVKLGFKVGDGLTVSRDRFTLASHLELQQRREAVAAREKGR